MYHTACAAIITRGYTGSQLAAETMTTGCSSAQSSATKILRSISDATLMSLMLFVFLTSVEAEEALVAEDLLGAVEAVLVHQLPDQGAGGALVLHAGLDQVDGVDGSGPGG